MTKMLCVWKCDRCYESSEPTNGLCDIPYKWVYVPSNEPHQSITYCPECAQESVKLTHTIQQFDEDEPRAFVSNKALVKAAKSIINTINGLDIYFEWSDGY